MSKPFLPDEYSCEDCLYCGLYSSEGEGFGTCRRHPPTRFIDEINNVTAFPIVNLKRDWCGKMELFSAASAELEEANNTKTTNTETTTDKE